MGDDSKMMKSKQNWMMKIEWRKKNFSPWFVSFAIQNGSKLYAERSQHYARVCPNLIRFEINSESVKDHILFALHE